MISQTFMDRVYGHLAKFNGAMRDQPAYKILAGKYKALSPLGKRTVQAGGLLFSLLLFLALLYAIFDVIVVIGFTASIAAGLATGLGALPMLFVKSVPARLFNSLLGAAAGVMLAATAFSLVMPGIDYGNLMWPGKGIYVVALGMLIGAVFLDMIDRRLPHIQFMEADAEKSRSLRKIWLFILAITVHNFPEGMAVGVSFGSGDMKNGITLAIAIALQNIPEGLAVALPLIGLGYTRSRAVFIALLTGLVEPVGGLLGVSAVTLFTSILPIAMGFAAGAMLFVITEEIIPESHAKGKSRAATFAIMGGFIVMMILDNMLG